MWSPERCQSTTDKPPTNQRQTNDKPPTTNDKPPTTTDNRIGNLPATELLGYKMLNSSQFVRKRLENPVEEDILVLGNDCPTIQRAELRASPRKLQ